MRLSEKRKWKLSFVPLGFVIPFLGMLVVMAACGRIPFGKTSMLYSDNYHQYYPFFVAFRNTLRSGGSLLYSWDVGMGVDYLGMISYYLASPLYLLAALVPDSMVLGYYSMLMPIKLGFAGLFFSLMLRRLYEKDELSVALFGSFYALCAWALGYQWNIMWLDTFALLPLVMLGMVSLLRDKRVVLYTLALFLSVFANYYIGLFTCFFVFLSFFCYEICCFRGWKRFFADLVRIGVFSALAIGMTAVLTVTSMAALQTTQSSVNQFPRSFRLNIVTKHNFLGLLDGMRQVAGNMGGGLEPTFKEGLPNLYCGVGSILLGFLFLLSDEVKLRDKLCSVFLLLFFNVSFLIRQLDYIWHGFHFPNMIPYRFSFLHSFVLLVMAYRAWQGRRKYDKLQVLAATLLTAAVLGCSNSLMSTQKWTFLKQDFDVPVYIVYNGGFLLAYFLLFFFGSGRPKKREDTREEVLRIRRTVRIRRRNSRVAFQVIAVLEAAATLTSFGFFFPGTSVSDYPRGREEAASMIRYMHEREEGNAFYRAETAHSQTLNDGALNGYSGISTFTSSANVRITEFMRTLGYGAKNTYNRYCYEESSPVANLFLNLKYMIEREGGDKNSSAFQEVHHFGRVGLYRNTAYLPLGFLTEPALAELNFDGGSGAFHFQNQLFRAATGIYGDIWYTLSTDYLDVIGNGVEVNEPAGNGFTSYSNPTNGASVIYSYVVNRDGFACVHLDLPKRNTIYVSVNGRELYREDISLPQMLAVQDVKAGDVIDIRLSCKSGENGTATVNLAILDNELFRLGYEILSANVMEQTHFSETLVEGTIDCSRDGLLYTSIPQNGNWKAYVDGQEAEIVLIGSCMIGVNLTAGTHTLRFAYWNGAFLLGGIVSLVSAALFALLALLLYRPGKQQPQQTEALPEAPVEELPELPAEEAPTEKQPDEEPSEETAEEVPEQQLDESENESE